MEDTQTSGWSDSMAKILQINVKSNNFILSKAKKDRDIVIEKNKSDEDPDNDLLVVDDKGETKKLQEDSDESDEVEVKKSSKKKSKRIKPERRSTWDRESELNALATKGVVQLFNAVNQHRKLISNSLESSGKTERKRDKALSKFSADTFMDILSTSKDGKEKVAKKKRFHDVLSEDIEGTTIRGWESDNSDS